MPSGPSSTTTLLGQQAPSTTPTNSVSRNNVQQYRIGTRSRTSGSSKATARAQLELKLARAREARIVAETNALDAASSRCSDKESEIDSLADPLSLAGLGSRQHHGPEAPNGKGAARSSEPRGADEVLADDQMQDTNAD